MKTFQAGWLVLFALSAALTVGAQSTNAPSAVLTPGVAPSDYWDVAIGLVCPVIVWALAKAMPRVPRAFLPVATPFVGVLMGLALNWLSGLNLPWYESAKAGALAVFVRESVNQWVTKGVSRPAAAPVPVALVAAVSPLPALTVISTGTHAK